MDDWVKFLAQSLGQRLEPDRFEKYAQLLSNRHHLSARQIADVLFRPTKHNWETFDPKIPQYVQRLLHVDLLDAPTVLRALLRYSNFYEPLESKQETEGQSITLKWKNSYAQAESILYGVSKLISTGLRPKTAQEALHLIIVLTEWTKVFTTQNNAHDIMHEAQATEAISIRSSLGTLLIATSENTRVVGVLGKSCPKGVRDDSVFSSHYGFLSTIENPVTISVICSQKDLNFTNFLTSHLIEILKQFSCSLASFIPLLLQSASMIAQRLELFRTQNLLPLEPVDKKAQATNDEIDQIIDSTLGIDAVPIVDLPVVNSRAGLYVYLQLLLVGRPLIDDNAIFNYLNNRYQGDIQSTCIDLILASFDVLANAIFRNEGTQTTILLRSFLTNKVPMLLVALSQSMFPPLTAEFCITEALSQVDTNMFPNLSSLFDESSMGNMFQDSVRQDFCFACCLHGLIAEENIESLLGEVSMQTLPPGGRYIKDDLVQQCMNNPERIEGLLEELEHMDGNVGVVSQTVVEMMRQYCEAKETMSLKTLCSHLARQPSSLDVMLLFDKPASILQPLCELLDGWRYDEDQGEYTPVYEEFGSVLLLVLAFVHRYNLSIVDLGLHNSTSFIGKLLVRGAISSSMDELSDQEKNQLDGWIRGLFNSAEGGGLGDEPMSNCPPQDFYLLVPTLFHQVVLACGTGHLSDDALKGGLEYLVDTFLLPSLVGAITWLAHHLWESRGDSSAVIHILQILIQQNSISSEANTMLGSVLNIIAKPLEHSLRWLQRSEPTRQDVEPLSKVLKPHILFSRTAGSDHTEIESWTNTHGGGISISIRNTIQSLAHWSLNPGPHVMPTSYTHRQILTGIRLLGAKRILSSIIEEVKAQTITGSSSVVIDIATAIICAPDADSAPSAANPAQLMNILDDASVTTQPLQRRLTLRDALRTEAENAAKIHKNNILHLEAIIRLYRRVEAMMTVAMAQAGVLDHQLSGLEVGSGGMDAGVGVGLGDGVLSGHQDIDDAFKAATDQEMMDVLGGDGMIGVGDDDLLFGIS